MSRRRKITRRRRLRVALPCTVGDCRRPEATSLTLSGPNQARVYRFCDDHAHMRDELVAIIAEQHG